MNGMSTFLKLLAFSCCLVLVACGSEAWAAGPFPYRLAGGAADAGAVTVVGEFQKHRLARYENMYDIARKYDLGFWELARFHRNLDHFYLPWDQEIVIPTRWIVPEHPNPPGYLINVAELRGYRFFPHRGEVRTYPIGVGVLDYKTPIGRRFRVQSKAENPGWRIPASLRGKYGRSFLPHSDENPIGSHWLGLGTYGLHGTHAPMGVGRLVSHGCMRHYPEDIKELYDLTPVGTSVEVIYEPVKFGHLQGRIFTEIHEDIYFKVPDLFLHALKKVEAKGLGSRINWTRFIQAVEERSGAPVDITR
jgi:L,D-transpeptidase ErfK/SrfK